MQRTTRLARFFSGQVLECFLLYPLGAERGAEGKGGVSLGSQAVTPFLCSKLAHTLGLRVESLFFLDTRRMKQNVAVLCRLERCEEPIREGNPTHASVHFSCPQEQRHLWRLRRNWQVEGLRMRVGRRV